MATEAAQDAAAGAAGHGGGHAVGMPQLDFSTWPNQIFWLAVTLVVIYFVLTRVALPRIGAVLAERSSTITNDLAAAELKVFRLADDALISLCTEVRNEPANCPIPATLQGRGTSDEQGVVRLTLPR